MTGPIVVDFETRPIVNGSGVAPRPVGVSIWQMGSEPIYYSWGHPGFNPHTYEQGRQALAAVWDKPLLFHNSKFDIAVAVEHMGLSWPEKFDDTMYQLYLHNPIAKTLSLKPSSEALLGMLPEEQHAVRDWLKAHYRSHKIPLLPEHKQVTDNNFGAYISYAPYEVVAPYANGDTLRTGKLHNFLMPDLAQRNMLEAYEREIKLTRIAYEMESVGVRVDRERLLVDQLRYSAIIEKLETKLREYLGNINLSPAEIAKALEASPLAGPLPRTPTGRLSTAAAALEGAILDRGLLQTLRYRSTLLTLTGTFFSNWIKYSARDGNVHPSWNQVRGDNGGTRTGRFSCSEPNFQNVPTEFGEYNKEKADENQDILWGLDIPFMRQYILPDEGHVIVPADYNGQEMRILAHFAEGKALEIYQNDPRADFHVVAAKLVREVSGLPIKRKQAKITGFSLIYGAGVTSLAAQLGVGYDEGRAIKNAYLKAIPGLADFQDTFNYRSEVRTWGGRVIPVEPPRMFNGSLWEFNYKLCNYLIQGSAADQTKEAMIRYDAGAQDGSLLLTVHDELVITCPLDRLGTEVPILRDAMENQPRWDCPFVAEVEYGKNWHELEPYLE